MSTCQQCAAEFSCGMSEAPNAPPCWCTTLPTLPPSRYESAGGCYCPQCLRERIAAASKASDE